MTDRIALIGLPGAGKTTLGRVLAPRCGCAFLDLDEEVVRAAGRSIPEVFAMDGEEGFRRREREALAQLAATGSLVLATGGGIVEAPENRLLLKERFSVVWLRIEPSLAARRCCGGGRPLLLGDTEARLRTLALRREAWYADCAHFVLEVGELDPEALAEALLDRLR